MGRHTYEVFAQGWPDRDGEYADWINATAKYVASRTLQNPTWTNTTVLHGTWSKRSANSSKTPT